MQGALARGYEFTGKGTIYGRAGSDVFNEALIAEG